MAHHSSTGFHGLGHPTRRVSGAAGAAMSGDLGHGKSIFVFYAAAYPFYAHQGGDEPRWYERLKKRDVAFASDLQAQDHIVTVFSDPKNLH
jgi:hypothetical protein